MALSEGGVLSVRGPMTQWRNRRLFRGGNAGSGGRDIMQFAPLGGIPGNYARITGGGLFSCNQGYAGTEIFGANAVAGDAGQSQGTNSVIIGNAAIANASCVVIGQGALAQQSQSVAIGQGAQSANGASGAGNVAIGCGATCPAGISSAIALGFQATVPNIAGVNNVMVVAPIYDAYFGNGYYNSSPISATIHGTGGNGSNIAGANIKIAGGIGTGTGAGGSVLIQTAAAGTTGSSANTLTTVVTIDSTSLVTINGNLKLGTAGNKISITTGSNASAGTGTLSGGTVTISTTAVTSSSLIFLTDTSSGANIGTLSVGTITNGVSFVVNSSNVLDASTFNWLIIN